MDHDPAAPDLEPLAKRARLDLGDMAMSIAHSPIVGVLEQDGDDADSDFYGDDAPRQAVTIANGVVCDDSPQTGDRAGDAPGGGGIPGLLMMDQSVNVGGDLGGDGSVSDSKEDDEVSRQLAVEHVAAHDTTHDDIQNTVDSAPSLQTETTVTPSSKPAELEAAPASDDVVMADCSDAREAVAREEVGGEEDDKEEGEVLETNDNSDIPVVKKEDDAEGPRLEGEKQVETKSSGEGDAVADVAGNAQDTAASLLSSLFKDPAEKTSKPPPDPEFLALAAAQKGDKNAEWQYDTSDAESSSDSSDSDDDSEDDSEEEGYAGMKPEDIAKVLMQEDFNEDGPSTGAGPLRTKNEVPEDEEKIERPNIIVTPEMKIEELGKVETIIDNMVLIKAITSGEYQVLSEGSLLVLEDRSVVGIVADTLGRVEEPLYTVRFNSAGEVKDLKVAEGGKVFYVPDHSTYVFTKPLLAQKGTDASNLYDEEPAESEQEFSDDEAEALYKRRKKEERKSTNGDKNADKNDRNKNFKGNKKPWVPQEPPAPVGPATLNYDEPYVPLQRPANLHEMASQPPPPLPSSLRGRGRSGKGDRGDRGGFRGRGNDRGRGGRGRGNEGRGRGGNDRSGRGRGYDRGPGGDRGDRNENRGGGDRGVDRGDRGDRARGGYDRGHEGGRGGRGGRDQGGRNRDRDDRDRDQGNRDDSRNRSPRAHRDQFKGPHRDDRTDDYYHKQRDRQGQQQPKQQQQDQSLQQGYPPPPLPQAMPQFTGFAGPQPQSPGIQGGWQQPVFPGFPQFPMGFQFPGMPPIPPPPPQQHAGAHVNPSFFGNPQGAPVPQQQQQQQQPAQVPAWMQGFIQQQPSYQPQQASSEDAFRALQQTLALLKQGQQQQPQ